MKLPFLNLRRQKSSKSTSNFMGLNRKPIISEGELSAMVNMSSNDLPALTPRKSRTIISEDIEKPNALFTFDGKLCWVDGTDFVYDGDVVGEVTDGPKSIVEFAGKIFIFPDKVYYDVEQDDFDDIGNGGTYPTTGSCPDLDYVCVHSNRIFGVKGEEIYASAFNNPFDWTLFDAVDDNSWGRTVPGDGDFTGICTYQNHVVAFKDDTTYEIYGYIPSNFTIKKAFEKGTIDNRSIKEVNGILYFLGRDGINTYAGGLPQVISDPLYDTFSKCVAGSDGRKYYASMYNGTKWQLFVFDSFAGVWNKEDDVEVRGFALIDGDIYAMTYQFDIGQNYGFLSDFTQSYVENWTHEQLNTAIYNFLFKLNSGNEIVPWSFVTNRFSNGSIKTGYSKIKLTAEMDAGSSIFVYVKNDDEDWLLYSNITSTRFQTYSVVVQHKRCDSFQIKVEGAGPAKVYSLEREFFYSTDK